MDYQSTALYKTAIFLVSENRNSDLDPEKRKEILLNKKTGRLLYFLYKFGFPGGMIYTARAVFKPAGFSVFRNIIIEDHASKVVFNSLKRYYGEPVEKKTVKSFPSQLNVFISFLKNIRRMHKAYQDAEIKHFTEYARIFKLFYFYISCDGYLGKMSVKAVMFARTNDQKRLALGAAAEENNIPLVAYTVDRVDIRKPAPFKINRQLCWTAGQKKFCDNQKIESVVMPVPYTKKIKTDIPSVENAVCGFLLNAKCNLQRVKQYLCILRDTYGIENICLRPHPGFDENKLDVLNGFKIADWREPLDEYLERLDMVFALNTNAMIEALLHGVPIVYISGLDSYEEDLHGFVAEGIVLQFNGGFKYPESIYDFYESDAFNNNWNPEFFTTDGTSEYKMLDKILNG